MAERLHVGTRKGLFEFVRSNGGWEIVDVRFLGDPVSAVLAEPDGSLYAALDLGHFGAKLWRRDRAGEWSELAVPTFPPKPQDAGDDPHPWTLGKIWVLEPGGVAGRRSLSRPGGVRGVAARVGVPDRQERGGQPRPMPRIGGRARR